MHHLKKFLPSVISTQYDNFEIIIADNNSTDGTAEWLLERYPEVIHVKLDDNYGYCGGNNRAAKFATKEILLFLNNDVAVEKDWLNGLGDAFSQNEELGAAQPKILDYKNREYFEYAGAAGGMLDKFGYPFCKGRIFDTVEKDVGQFEEKSNIFWASGAALTIRKNLFEHLNGFDEDFEFHMEEIDLCWRLQRSGHPIIYIPKSRVYHLGGGSLPMGSPRKVYYNFRNNLVMLWKNETKRNLVVIMPIRWFLDGVAALRALLTGNFRDFGAIFKAHMYFIRNFKSINNKRKTHYPENKMPMEGRFNISIIWRYYIKKQKHFSQIISKH